MFRGITLSVVLFASAISADDSKVVPAKEKEQLPVKEKEEPPADVDVGKTTERIVTDAKEASKRLGDKDSGAKTQELQKDIVKNLDELIRKAQQPPPMSTSDSSSSSSSGMNTGAPGSKKQPMDNNGDGTGSKKQPMDNNGDGTGSKKQPMDKGSGPSSSAERKERREKRQREESAAGRGNPQPSPFNQNPDQTKRLGSASPLPNKFEPKGGEMPRLPDVYKDVWGHLPEKMRQEMDLYFREQFMPRYSELLRQYYSSLAESGNKGVR